MFAEERRRKILELLREEGSARVAALSETFNVSEPTIRQDLERLERQGHVVREHGGAFLRSVAQQVRALSLEHMENLDKKMRIGARAVKEIKDGERIILDSGSTVTEIARRLHDHHDLTIITNALNIALIVGAEYTFDLMVTGGEFKPPTLSLTGEKAAGFLKNMFVDRLFLATGGISSSFELTYPGFSDLPVKRAMVEAAGTIYIVADSTKFGNTAFASLGSISCAKYLITDSGIKNETVARLGDLGVEVLIAE
ncbi:MAG: DeoR/GlpR transcriptional regulator [Spirochaetaceae bacterium]|nr:MAG: DeoR/GlpR transcriptional regulator [Spirochaetaceae bacterium]